MQLSRAIHPRFPFGSVSEILNLAAYNNSPDRSTKSTTSRLDALCVLVNTEFQVLFHSPPGVLFTFPSQYFSTIGHWVVFRLGGWSPRLRCGFLVSASPPRSLATTCGISVDVFSSSYLDVSVRKVPRVRLFYSAHAPRFFITVVSQFGYLRIRAYLQLPAAFRSLSRPSSAPNAKAFSLCSF